MIITFTALSAGILIGIIICWLVFRERLKSAEARGRAQSQSEIAALSERLSGRDLQITEQKGRVESQDSELRVLREQVMSLRETQSQLQTAIGQERRVSQEKLDLLNEAQKQLGDAFKALSSDALKSNNASFLELAKTTLEKYQETARGDLDKRHQAIGEMVGPVRETLEKFDVKIAEMEKARAGAYEGIREQVKGLLETQNQLRAETSNLVRALSSPKVYGRWGEVQLKRLVELSGMLDHCDFIEQHSVNTEDGRLRPDMVVLLPAGKTIVVDVKVPMSAYLDALKLTDEKERQAKLADHARLVKDHMTGLSRKSYWDQFEQAPEFVVMFLPNETFLTAALEQVPDLIEIGAQQRVILSTPTTLIALLKAISYGWRQERIAENARAISELGAEMYKRLSDMNSHLAELGNRLGKAVECYNKTVGTLETRVLVSARKFRELSATAGDSEIEPIVPLEQFPRQLQVPDVTDS